MEYVGLSAVALGRGHQIAKERGGTGTATERALVSTFSPCHRPIPEMEQIMSIGLLYGIMALYSNWPSNSIQGRISIIQRVAKMWVEASQEHRDARHLIHIYSYQLLQTGSLFQSIHPTLHDFYGCQVAVLQNLSLHIWRVA